MRPLDMAPILIRLTKCVVRIFGVADSVAVSQEDFECFRRIARRHSHNADSLSSYIHYPERRISRTINAISAGVADTLHDSHIAVIRTPNADVVALIGGLSSCL